MIARNLIETARSLIPAGRGRPRETDLRRAASTTYYAAFHRLMQCCADRLVGAGLARQTPAWNRVYRALNHAQCARVCRREARGLSIPVRALTDLLPDLMGRRHAAGLRPRCRLHEVGGPRRHWRDRSCVGRVRQIIRQRSARARRLPAVPRAARLISRRLPFPITAGPRECPAFGRLAAARLRRVLFRLQEATDPRSADAPEFRLHPLNGDRAGQWSVRVSGNWRVVFRFEDKEVVDVDLMDHH